MKYRKIKARMKQRLVASEGVPMFCISNHYSEASSYRGKPWRSSIFSIFTALQLRECGSVDVNITRLFPHSFQSPENIIFEMTALFVSVFDDFFSLQNVIVDWKWILNCDGK
jgi:hypothetical protein